MSIKKLASTERQMREILTPEGVTLKVELAQTGDRAGAVLIDLLLLFVGMILGALGIGLTTGFAGLGRFGIILILLLLFLFRNFYFMFFELKWQGQTPGKRRLGLKVIDRFGRPLSSEAIFARNMMREIEIFLPMGIIFSGSATGVSGIMQLFALIWALVLVFLPTMNRDHLRAGDLVAGTLVVREPRVKLAADMLSGAEDEEKSAYSFTVGQLELYGIYELQMLEDLLRNQSLEAAAKRQTAGQTIIRKIDWPDRVTHGRMDAFLQAYYNALRKHLEGKLLMGTRKENKFDKDVGGRKN
ncbi:RDD family protein [Kordiimonas aestuarii]|uniref:RDD family protein n=1 Tax=Kordiimonas aestuarii TaxID=1005925 RepID=UPI0021D09426|nr:RDD family protein [Kordiimonas aestuarii]